MFSLIDLSIIIALFINAVAILHEDRFLARSKYSIIYKIFFKNPKKIIN